MKLIGITALFFLFACQTPTGKTTKGPADSVVVASAAAAAPDTTSLGGPWYLQPVLPSDTATGKAAFFVLDVTKSRFSGNTGCNTMRGEFWYSKNDSSLAFSDKIATTRMACPGYNEPAFMKSLKNTTHYRLRNNTLTLLAEDNSELSRWLRKPVAPSLKPLKA
jgi:heat shock protein HslJ